MLSVNAADSVTQLEDIYLPYRPKRRTRATIAKEQGLEPLADVLFNQQSTADPQAEATKYVSTEKGVADIAAAYGHTAELSREHMLYCLFRHTAAQALRDLVARAGERLLVRKTSARVLRTIAGKIGVRLTRRVLGEGLSRWLPVLGAVGVGGYAYFDTAQVARTAIEMFSRKVVVEPDGQ